MKEGIPEIQLVVSMELRCLRNGETGDAMELGVKSPYNDSIYQLKNIKIEIPYW